MGVLNHWILLLNNKKYKYIQLIQVDTPKTVSVSTLTSIYNWGDLTYQVSTRSVNYEWQLTLELKSRRQPKEYTELEEYHEIDPWFSLIGFSLVRFSVVPLDGPVNSR